MQLQGINTAVAVSRERASADADTSVRQTVALMWKHIAAGCNDPAVIAAGRAAVSTYAIDSLRSNPALRDFHACWWWVRHNVRFVSDERALERLLNESDQVELLISPGVLLRMSSPEGDCDDFSMVLAAMLRSLGHSVDIVTVAAESETPWRLSHVYLLATIGRDRVALDASHGVYPGWEVPKNRQYRRLVHRPDGSFVDETMNNRGGYQRGMGFVSSQSPISGGGGFSTTGGASPWSSVLQQLALVGGGILQQKVAPLKPGEYVQTAEGVRSRDVPGAVPGQTTSALNVGASISSSTMMMLGLGAAVLLAVVVSKGRN